MVNIFCRIASHWSVLLLILIGLAGNAFAQRPVSHWVPRVEARSADLIVNDTVVVRFHGNRGGRNPFERAQLAASIVQQAVERGARSGAVRVDDSNPDAPSLRIAGSPVTMAVAQDVPAVKSKRRRRRLLRIARANAYAEASRWASTLKRALSLPGLTLSDQGQVIPLAENRSLRLRGAARGEVHITTLTGNSPVVGWQVDPGRNLVTLSGLKPGREVVFIEREGAVAVCYVAVKPYAGQFQMPRPVVVTGNMTPASLIGRLARVMALASVNLTSGATKQITTRSLDVSSVPAGQTGTVVVPMRLTGPDMLPVERKVFIPVINRRLPYALTTTLFYSNNPERVTAPGSLFVGRMPEGNKTVRLLYHHQNVSPASLDFCAELINDAGTPVQVQIVGGDAGPERDTVWVGYRAAADYLRASEQDTGVIVDIPAHARLPLSTLRMPTGLTVSGLMHLRTISGPAPLVHISIEPAMSAGCMPFLSMPLDTWHKEVTDPANFSEHIYPNPAQKLEAEYTVGGAWTFIKYGRAGITASTSPQVVLHGNYGVLYDIDIKLRNPTNSPARVRLVFEPSAGMAGGIFRIGNRKVEIPRSDMPDETDLAAYTLEAGESRSVTVRTLPLSGSNYPATIIVRP